MSFLKINSLNRSLLQTLLKLTNFERKTNFLSCFNKTNAESFVYNLKNNCKTLMYVTEQTELKSFVFSREDLS